MDLADPTPDAVAGRVFAPSCVIDLLATLQLGLPLVPRPFAEIAAAGGLDEAGVIATIAAEQARGRIRRLGAVLAPGAFGASLLAALAVPRRHLARVGDRIARLPEVNHCYQREAVGPDAVAYNLWFVVAAPDRRRLHAALDAIDALAGPPPSDPHPPRMLRMPLRHEFHCDLAFALDGRSRPKRPRPSFVGDADPRGTDPSIDPGLLAALEDGLPLVPRPFAMLAGKIGTDEAVVLARLRTWAADGRMRRLAAVLDHPSLGFGANAMGVWNVPADQLEAAAAALVEQREVHLCYERERAPGWPYNLYAMVFGTDPAALQRTVARIERLPALAGWRSRMLVTRRRFKQTGARYGAANQAMR